MNSSPLFAQASWIASSVVGGKRTCAPVPYVRKSFQINQPVKSARLNITALGLYECEINGQRIGDEIFTPGWTEYHKRVQFQSYDVTELLHLGENALGAILGDGWYCGIVGWIGRQVYGDRPRLLARLEVILQDGSTLDIVTDSSWKTTIGPILESDIMMGEVYDARRELGAWSRGGYDESRWLPVQVAPPEHPVEIVPRMGPPVRALGEIKSISERRVWEDRTRIFDLGQNFTGRARLRVKTSPGAYVQIRFAEILNSDQGLYTENLRNARCTDTYTTKGDGIETWEPRFTFHGFRYIEVSCEALKPGDLVEVTGIVLHSDTAPIGSFRCSHEGLNQLQHNIIWGQKSNFLEIPTDCPQRDERLGWTGDAQVFVRTASFNMNVREFFHKWMQDMRDSQTEEGGIPCVIPAPWHHDPASQDGGPAWADAEVICPWTIYLCYGDKEILVEHYESMQRFMAFMAKHRCRGHIRNHPDVVEWQGFGDWLALDGGGKTEGITPFDLIGTAFYAYDADLMSKIADVLGRHDDAKKYRALHGEIVDAFRHRFVTADGLVASGTQTAYVLALRFNLVEEPARAVTIRELVRNIEKRNYHLATGFVGTPYILDVLEKAGHIDVAYKLLEQETFPSWLFPVRNGATTIWERWDGWTPDKGFQDKGMNSFNHYAYGAVGDWMYHTVAGLELDPNQPGYAHIIFRPRPGGSITWAEAKLQTAHGKAGIHWDLSGDALTVKLTVPANCSATLSPPPGYAASESKYGEGSHQVVLRKE
jgi:alpha-L-rhamnosidase